jgi:hypothetical protein
MDAGLVVVWGIALVAIVGLSAAVAVTLRQGPGPAQLAEDEPDQPAPIRDILLFYYEQDGVRSTADAQVIVHIPGVAWDAGWRADMLRLEVNEQPPAEVMLAGELSQAEVLAVYDLLAYRMTELGTDIGIQRFLEPVNVILTTDRPEGRLGVAVRIDDAWAAATPSDVHPRDLVGIDPPPGLRWAAAAITRPGRVCLVCLPVPEEKSPA